MIGTEVGHSLLSSNSYGVRGDSNCQQVALCEGWAYYRGWKMPNTYLGYYDKRGGFPCDYQDMYNDLSSNGCSLSNMEKCLTAKTFAEYKTLLINIYSNDLIKVNNIATIIDSYYNKTF